MANEYSEMMMAKPLVKVDSLSKLKYGQLIGFKALCGEGKITASYPVWVQRGDEIQFVLYVQNGHAVIDNTWISSEDIFTNDEPIIAELDITERPSTFQNEIVKFFSGI